MLNVLLVDDEPLARQRLERLLTPFFESGRLSLVGKAADGIEALDFVTKQTVQLLFLDVQMPELDGFAVLDRLAPENRPAVIFTTAHDQYALRAFEANAVDYLLKPIEAERLEKAVHRAEARHEKNDGSVQDKLAELLEYLDHQAIERTDEPAVHAQPYADQLSVPGKDRLLVIPVDDLVAAEVQDGITRLFVRTQKPDGTSAIARYIVSYTLDTLESRLDPARFMRVHRSALVQLHHIREMVSWFSGRYKLILTAGHEVLASRARSKALRDRLSL